MKEEVGGSRAQHTGHKSERLEAAWLVLNFGSVVLNMICFEVNGKPVEAQAMKPKLRHLNTPKLP